MLSAKDAALAQATAELERARSLLDAMQARIDEIEQRAQSNEAALLVAIAQLERIDASEPNETP